MPIGQLSAVGNLTVPDANTDGIHITADNVTLDLNGYAILGPVTCDPFSLPKKCSAIGTGVGIFSNNSNTGLSNGAINGMGAVGIILGGIGGRIDGLRVANSGDPTRVAIAVSDALISHCTVTGNAGEGINAFRGTVTQSYIAWNGGFGIQGVADQGLVASNNTVTLNGQDGMNNVTLAINNSIFRNAGFGFSCTIIPGVTCSFESNAIGLNQLGAVHGGTSLGHNSCNSTAC